MTPPQDPLRAAVDDLHRWDVSRGWPAFNVILARIDAALPAATEPADGLLDVERLGHAIVAAVRAERAPIGYKGDGWPAYWEKDRPATVLAVGSLAKRLAAEYVALRTEPVPGDGG